MKLKNVYFRRMTILYAIIIAIMICGFRCVLVTTTNIGIKIDESVRDQNFVLSYKEEQKEIKGANIVKEVKFVKYLIDIDTSLKGNECLGTPNYFGYRNIGDEVSLTFDDTVKCVIKDFKKASNEPYNFYVSEETYNSIKDENHSYLVKIHSYKDYTRLEKDKNVVSLSIPEPVGNYFEDRVYYEFNVCIMIGELIVALLIIVIIFVNTDGYIRANSKKKANNLVKLTVSSTLLTIFTGYVIGEIVSCLAIYFTAL